MPKLKLIEYSQPRCVVTALNFHLPAPLKVIKKANILYHNLYGVNFVPWTLDTPLPLRKGESKLYRDRLNTDTVKN